MFGGSFVVCVVLFLSTTERGKLSLCGWQGTIETHCNQRRIWGSCPWAPALDRLSCRVGVGLKLDIPCVFGIFLMYVCFSFQDCHVPLWEEISSCEIWTLRSGAYLLGTSSPLLFIVFSSFGALSVCFFCMPNKSVVSSFWVAVSYLRLGPKYNKL